MSEFSIEIEVPGAVEMYAYQTRESTEAPSGSVAWDDVTGKPSTFAPAAHTHGWDDVTGKPSTFTPSAHTHGWDDVTGKPSTFAPSAHTHGWDEVTGKPSTFTPSAHIHAINEVTGLSTELDNLKAKLLYITATPSTSTVAASQIRFFSVAGQVGAASGEASCNQVVPAPCTVRKLICYLVITTAITGSATIVLRKNGTSDTTWIINIPAGSTTGVFIGSNSTPLVPVTFVEGDLWSYRIVGATTGSIQINNVTIGIQV